MLKIPVTVVMPAVAPLTKIQNCRDMGATVIVEGEHLGESRLYAMNYSKQKGLKYINGYDHPDVIAGAGTMGMEIVEQVPDVDAVIVPIGGAGLIAGTALAIKTLRPNALVIVRVREREKGRGRTRGKRNLPHCVSRSVLPSFRPSPLGPCALLGCAFDPCLLRRHRVSSLRRFRRSPRR